MRQGIVCLLGNFLAFIPVGDKDRAQWYKWPIDLLLDQFSLVSHIHVFFVTTCPVPINVLSLLFDIM